MIEDFQLADCQKRIAAPHKDFGSGISNGASDGFTETNGDLWSIRRKEVIPELTYDVVAGGLSIQNLHERGPVLCSASRTSVCVLTNLQNSSSVSCFEARPSASSVSSSSGVPAKPGTVRCSTGVKAASTTSSTDL